MDWVHNTLVPVRSVPTHKHNVRAHSGFLAQYMSLHSDLAAELKTTGASRVLLCRHSLGGALACIAIAMLARWLDCPFDLVTFGAPRPGNSALAAQVRGECGRCMRVVHDRDIVPTMPMSKLMYTHVTPSWLCLDEAGRVDQQTHERSLLEELWLRLWGILSLDFGISDHFIDRYMRGVKASTSQAPAQSAPDQVGAMHASAAQQYHVHEESASQPAADTTSTPAAEPSSTATEDQDAAGQDAEEEAGSPTDEPESGSTDEPQP